ncbi:MAG: tetratricopeptide repeat protein [Phycisphaerales bacterium]|nr:MAG: tetratricopeptide repeat protein [Phycisphaerales bacterium]
MRGLFIVCALTLCLPALAVNPAPGAENTAPSRQQTAPPTDARELLDTLLRADRVEVEQQDEAKSLFEQGAAREPGDGRWSAGLALIARVQGDGEAAMSHGRDAVRLSPEDADAHYQLGSALFAGLRGASMLKAASLSREGREAYERAVELDPEHERAHFSLMMYYAFAPRIAGGNPLRAFEHAELLLAMPDGVYFGHIGHALLAAKDEDWMLMRRHYDLAEEAARSDEERRQALLSHASNLMRQKGDHAAAIPLLERALVLAPEDAGLWRMLGDARREAKKCGDAVEAYRRSLAINNASGSAQFNIAKCLEDLGRNGDALREYTVFVERFPDDAQVREARRRIRALQPRRR